MQDVAGGGSPLPAWESFYVIIGSSSAGLTGLMFVVMTLIPETRRRAANRTINAFATPNVVHSARRSSSPPFSARPGIRWRTSASSWG
jgi:hypothetical protein